MTTNTLTAPAAAAGTWQLGDLTVNRMGFGAMRLGGMPWDPQPRSREGALGVLRRAVELGVNLIDTSAFYFTPLRSSNELISTALQPYDDDLVIATKVGPGRSRTGEFEDYARPDQLREQVEENVRQLGRDGLDLVYLRWGHGHGKAEGSIAEHLGALADLRDAGLIRHLGVSNVTADQLREALTVAPVVAVENRYGLDNRQDDDIVALTGEHGVAFVPFFAMAGRAPGEAPSAEAQALDDAVAAVAAAHEATPSQVRLAWTLHQGTHVLAIPGTGDPAHLEQNVAAASLRLTPQELATLA
ncbi:MAG: oxidoreductase [Promicromonosporaceae bacterium]|nr:oxidoreductase [Promicromonosporaceae bacterium]